MNTANHHRSVGFLLTLLFFISLAGPQLARAGGQSCDPPPSGLVGWWKADGNVYDSAGTNNGVIVNAGYTNGIVGEAFEIDPENWTVGTFNGIKTPDSPAYILTNAFTIECWIRPRGDSYEIVTRGDNRPGLDPYSFSMQDDHIFQFAITDNSGNSCTLTVPLVYNLWWHMAGTYSNGVMILYTNGAVAAQTTTAVVPIGALIPGDHPGLGIGNNNDGYNNFPFTGDIDEVSLYNRALSHAEVQAIYNAGSAGKCFNPPPSCDPPPSGLVSWWAGENNANDQVGTNNGTWIGPAAYGPGEVSQAFAFNGSNSGVNLGNPAGLQLQTLTIELWVKRASASTLSFGSGNNANLLTYGWGGYTFWEDSSGDVHFNKYGDVTPLTGPAITDTNWHHVAVTYSGAAVDFYLDGVLSGSNSYNETFTFTTPVSFGWGASDMDGNFYGSFDEVSVYNRALSQAEIQAIYNAGSNGKCLTPTPPVITTQPTNETVLMGQTATFSVTASGTQPLGYQWTFDTTNIVRATNAIFTLSDVQFTNAGTYAVVVSNLVESVLSSNAVLTVTVPPCDPPPSGLVGWWKGDGNAWDSSSNGNNGVVNGNLSYGSGEVGQCFLMDGSTAFVHIPASSNMNVGTGGGFSIEGWIDPADVSVEHPMVEWNNGQGYGSHFWISVRGVGNIYANLVDTAGAFHQIVSANGLVQSNVFQHVALTYNKTSGLATLYLNGVMVTQQNLGNFTPQTSYDLYLGYRPTPDIENYWVGGIDEMSLYNRALSQSEIQAIYNAGSSGKCFTPTPPVIITQPTNQTAFVGQTAAFSVSVMSTTPVTYQWTFDTTNIVGATNATFTLSDVQFTNAGTYAVMVSNFVESVLSSNAVLTVNPPPPCDPPPSGLVGWWKGDGNTLDSAGANNGGVVVNAGYTNGIVGQAFEIDPENWTYGTFNGVLIPDSPAYVLTNALTIECWIRPRGDGYTIFIRGDNPNNSYYLSMQHDNILQFGINDSSQNYCLITAPLVYNVWWHIAGTFNNGLLTLYTNGVIAAQTTTTLVPAGVLDPSDHPGVGIGNINDGYNNFPFTGDIDEVSLYNRALSHAEVQAIYNAGSAGKCFTPTPPVIIIQPTNQTAFVGNTVSLNVSVMSTTPVTYQWQFDGTNILDATNTTLTLSDVQVNEAGYYDVAVTNMVDGLVSSNALLTVSPLDHFSWAAVPSPRFLNVPFPVTIVAQDATNGTVLTYDDSVMLDSTNDIPISPVASGNFMQGVWTGMVVIPQTGTNIVLQADDGLGHTGLSNPFNALALPSVDLQISGNFLLLNWPLDYSSFELEESSNLFPAVWSAVPVTPLQIGNQYIVPLEKVGTNGFYRLRFSGP
ncbi:MAG TPA: LamG-like jellyroll fold domain-containing protein [Verrucomicrobiae bacterium]